MKTITLKFKDSDDLNFFEKYMAMAKAQEGTVTGLYCGLMCSALKRSEVVQSPNPELLEACKAARELVKLARQYFPKSVSNSDTFHLLNVDANTLGKAISKAEGQS